MAGVAYFRSGRYTSTLPARVRRVDASSYPPLFHTTGRPPGTGRSSTRPSTWVKWVGVTSSMHAAPWSARRWNTAYNSSSVSVFPAPPRLMGAFWQNTQPRAQPEKNTVPAPAAPDRQGSSQGWRAARAHTGRAGIWQKPSPWAASRRAPHRRGQRLQVMAPPSPSKDGRCPRASPPVPLTAAPRRPGPLTSNASGTGRCSVHWRPAPPAPPP